MSGRQDVVADRNADILVAGTGPVGLIAALALARAGFSVSLVGPEPRLDDRRTTALMKPSLAFLDGLGVGAELAAAGAPLSAMRIVDATRRLVRSRPVTFRAAEIGEDLFGLNIPNTRLNTVLSEAAAAQAGIARLRTTVERWELTPGRAVAHLADGGTASAALVAAADGRASPAREAAGIATRANPLPQAALVLNFAHERDHESVSTEFHTETGPFTQVPLPGGRRSSLVWVVRPAEAEALAALPDEALSRRVEEAMQSMLGKVTVEPGRQVYPLSTVSPSRFAARRVALLGEAAHVIPPIGAQGLNLGIRDVEELTAIAGAHRDDPGGEAALADYDRRRRIDIVARTGAVNLLNRSLLSGFLPAQLARMAGLGALGAFAPLRGFFMREGLRPGSGLAALSGGLREKVGR
ncbi:MAG: UbiH/UbiF family hydroxylase [Rhizobiales bacterium]|nr:UbiH/UbiF family hydroxylase [Hyphomicrobiales bacterium]